MKTTVDALKALYVVLGGDADDVTNVVTIPDMIDEISAVVVPLPEVDADDNGKVLKVADGKWGVGTDATA